MRRSDTLVASAGAALLVTLFLPWYGLDFDGHATADAWQAFRVVDLLLFVTAAAAIAFPVLRAARLPAGQVIAALGALALLVIVARIFDPPGHGLGLRYGTPLGLLAAAGVLAAGWHARARSADARARTPRPRS